MEIKILVADDDAHLRELVCDIIKKEGYFPIRASDGKEALDLFFKHQEIDLIILDVMMPGYDGWEVLKEIRANSNVPVLMLTALGDERSEVHGLKNGADDYISKPFSYEVFVARLHSALRKTIMEKQCQIELGKIYINQATQSVTVDGVPIALNRKEYGLLLYLYKNKDHVVSRDQILSSIWGYDFLGDSRTVDTHVKMLRAKLAECGAYIKTIRGLGYMLEVDDL